MTSSHQAEKGEEEELPVPSGGELMEVAGWLIEEHGWRDEYVAKVRYFYDQEGIRIGGYKSLYELLQRDRDMVRGFLAYQEKERAAAEAEEKTSKTSGAADDPVVIKKKKKKKQKKQGGKGASSAASAGHKDKKVKEKASRAGAGAASSSSTSGTHAIKASERATPPADVSEEKEDDDEEEEEDTAVDMDMSQVTADLDPDELRPSDMQGLTLESIDGVDHNIRQRLMSSKLAGQLWRTLKGTDKRLTSNKADFFFESEKLGGASQLIHWVLTHHEHGFRPVILDFIYDHKLAPYYELISQRLEAEKARIRKRARPASSKAVASTGASSSSSLSKSKKGDKKAAKPSQQQQQQEVEEEDDDEDEDDDEEDSGAPEPPTKQAAGKGKKRTADAVSESVGTNKEKGGARANLATKVAKRRKSSQMVGSCVGSERYFGRGGGGSRRGEKAAEPVELASTAEVAAKVGNLPHGHQREIDRIDREFVAQFPIWTSQLKAGSHLVLYGLGSKRSIMEQLSQHLSAHGDVIFADGTNDISARRSRLVQLISRSVPGQRALQSIQGGSGADFEHVLGRGGGADGLARGLTGGLDAGEGGEAGRRRAFRRACVAKAAAAAASRPPGVLFESPAGPVAEHLFLVLFSMDSRGLLGSGTIELLQEMANYSLSVHLIGSVDNVNAPLLWVTERWDRPRWIWHETHTFAPYVVELKTLERSKARSAVGRAPPTKEGLLCLLKSLTVRHLDVLEMLAKHQLAGNKEGMSFDAICRECRNNMTARGDSQVKALFVELIDHMLLKRKNVNSGRESMYVIAAPDSHLREIIAFKARMVKAKAQQQPQQT